MDEWESGRVGEWENGGVGEWEKAAVSHSPTRPPPRAARCPHGAACGRRVPIAARAGGLSCGACARDAALARALIRLGHDVEIIPLYTPLRDDAGVLPTAPVFYGGISVALQQASRLFRRAPAWVGSALDSPALLRAVSRFAIEVRAENLGPMTVSVLAGRDGRQGRELARLLAYLESVERPDVVSITNTLLSAIAPEVKRRLGCPVVCSLQGEDSFVNAMPEPHRSEAWRWIRENARAVDRFVAPGEAYADRMADVLQVPRVRVGVVRAGLDPAPYRPAGPRPREPFTIGMLSVIIPAKGLDLLVEAFRVLVRERGRDARLRVAGKVLNARYWREVAGRIAAAGLGDRFEHVGEVDFAGKVEFLRRCSVFCLPTRIQEARGMAVMEAMAAGVPVVVPDHGVFPELVARTGGGILVPAVDPLSLAGALERLMGAPDEADQLGRLAAEGIARHHSAAGMAAAVMEEYRQGGAAVVGRAVRAVE